MFRFKLQPVLDMREREERSCMQEVARIERERRELVETIGALDSADRAERARLAEMLGGDGAGVDIGSVRLQAGASLHNRLTARDASVRLEGVEARLAEARAALARAAARRKGVEALRDRYRARYERRRKRKEDAALDDISGARVARALTEPEEVTR